MQNATLLAAVASGNRSNVTNIIANNNDIEYPVMLFVLLVSNIIYPVPALLSFAINYIELATYLFAVSIISPLHHLCYDGDICFGLSRDIMGRLDVAYAFTAMGLTLLTPAVYDLIKRRHIAHFRREGYLVRHTNDAKKKKERGGGRTTEEAQEEDDEELVLVKHRYADLYMTGYTIFTVSASLLATDSLWIYIVTSLYVLIVNVGHAIRYRHMKLRTLRDRYHWPTIVISVILASLSVYIFKSVEPRYGRMNHGLWHIDGAMACTAALVGTTAFGQRLRTLHRRGWRN